MSLTDHIRVTMSCETHRLGNGDTMHLTGSFTLHDCDMVGMLGRMLPDTVGPDSERQASGDWFMNPDAGVPYYWETKKDPRVREHHKNYGPSVLDNLKVRQALRTLELSRGASRALLLDSEDAG